jgi:hypothetical protein
MLTHIAKIEGRIDHAGMKIQCLGMQVLRMDQTRPVGLIRAEQGWRAEETLAIPIGENPASLFDERQAKARA